MGGTAEDLSSDMNGAKRGAPQACCGVVHCQVAGSLPQSVEAC